MRCSSHLQLWIPPGQRSAALNNNNYELIWSWMLRTQSVETTKAHRTLSDLQVINSGFSSASPSLLFLLIPFILITSVVSMVDKRESDFWLHLYPCVFITDLPFNLSFPFFFCEKSSIDCFKKKQYFLKALISLSLTLSNSLLLSDFLELLEFLLHNLRIPHK